MAQTSALKRALFERLSQRTGTLVTGGEQKFLNGEEWADADLQNRKDDRFLQTLIRLRQSRDLDRSGGARITEFHEDGASAPIRVERVDDLDDPEMQRALMLVREVARVAGTRTQVRDFRTLTFGNPRRVISRKRAVNLLKSEAMRLIPVVELKARGVPPDRHSVTVSNRPWGPWSGGTLEQAIDMTIHWGASNWRVERRFVWTAGTLRRLEMPAMVEGASRVLVAEGSYLDHLRRAAHSIARPLGWSEADAAWFLLTGSIHVVRPVRVTTSVNLANGEFQLAEVTIKAQPFASPTTVANQFAAAQRRLTGHRKGRPIEWSNLRVFDFVENLLARRGPKPTWRVRMEDWNESGVPNRWKYKRYSAMRRDYEETKRRLLFPGYTNALPIRTVEEPATPPDAQPSE